MALRAIIDGEDKVAPLLNDAEWGSLRFAASRKEKIVMMPCCNTIGRLRISKLGTKHFYHSRAANCDWKPETVEHLRAKAEILIACQEAGYQASPEKCGIDWRADVYAEKGKVKIAFEVQWSKQTLEETQERQARYKRDDITGFWFFRKPPYEFKSSFVANNELPIFELSGGQSLEEPFWVQAPALHSSEKPLLLPIFVKSFLKRDIRYRSLMTSDNTQHIKVVFVPERCWKCKAISHVYYVDEPYKSRCGEQMIGDEDEAAHYEFRPEIISAVRHFLKSTQQLLKVGEIKPRFSKTEKRFYMSFGCHRCDAIFGNFFLYNSFDATITSARMYGTGDVSFEVKVAVEDPLSQKQNHWCHPIDGHFCDTLFA